MSTFYYFFGGAVYALLGVILAYPIGILLYYSSRGRFRSTLLWLSLLISALGFLAVNSNQFGSTIFLVLGSLSTASGFLFAATGDKFKKKLKNKNTGKEVVRIPTGTGEAFNKVASIIAPLISVLILPALIFFPIQIKSSLERKKVLRFKKNSYYSIKLGDKYLDLPCRREFHIFRPTQFCTLDTPSKLSDYSVVRALKIRPKAHRELPCPWSESNTRFCDIDFLPYNLTLVGIQEARNNEKQYPKKYENLYADTPQKTLGRLIILNEKEIHSDNRAVSKRYKFRKDSEDSTGHLTCRSLDRSKFGCALTINSNDKFWSAQVGFKSELNQIENEVERITAEVSTYYEKLIKDYAVSGNKKP